MGGASVEASGPQRSNNRMEVSVCAELLVGRLEACDCRVADEIMSRGVSYYCLGIIGCVLCRSRYLACIRLVTERTV